MAKYFEYRLEKTPRIPYEAYCTGIIIGSAPIIFSVFFGEHLLFGVPFGWETLEHYSVTGLVIGLFATMVAICFCEDEEQNFRFGKDGFYWDNGMEEFYRPAEKIRRITFTRSGKLRLTDSLGETFRADKLVYSELAEKQLAECFPMAWVQGAPEI